MTAPNDPYLSVSEICTTLGVGETLVYNAVNNGHLRFRQVGRARRIRSSWVQEWLDAGARAGKFKPGVPMPVVERMCAEAAAKALEAAADDWGSQIRNGGAGSWLRERAAALRSEATS